MNNSIVPDIIVGTSTVMDKAQELLVQKPADTILTCGMSADELRAVFASIDTIFTDADGTVVEEGLTTFPAEYADYITKLSKLNIKTTLITGKPYAEIKKLLANLPEGLPMRIIYEKGAYYLEPDSDGVLQKHYLLSSEDLERRMLKLRELYLEHKHEIEEKYIDEKGNPRVTLGWSGSGAHQSLLSIDILAGTPPENYMDIVGVPREALKVKDPELLAKVEADLTEFAHTYEPDWKLVHIGNGNTEIAPDIIEKDVTLMNLPDFKVAKGIMVWGDSMNDLKMFEMRKLPQVTAGLVLHRERSLDLVNKVDFVSFGMANAKPFFELLLATHGA